MGGHDKSTLWRDLKDRQMLEKNFFGGSGWQAQRQKTTQKRQQLPTASTASAPTEAQSTVRH